MNLARRYRPKRFEEVIGQELVVRTLSEALKKDKIAPAYIFSGPRGAGKTTCARIFARAVSCLEKKTDKRPCDKCSSCEAHLNGKSSDLREIDGASHTGVDDVRSIIESVAYRPAISARTVYIIDEVHMLSNAAFNALLKTLEEPPAHCLFLFATTEVEKIPSTILSRTQRMSLRKLSQIEIVQNLKSLCASEKIKAQESALEDIAVAADGSLRDAQTLLDQAVLLSGSLTLNEEFLSQFLGTIGVEQELKILESLGTQQIDPILKSLSSFDNQGKNFLSLHSRLVQWIRLLLIERASPKMDLLDQEASPEQRKRLQTAFQNWSAPDLDELFEIFYSNYERIRKSDRPRIVLETTFLRAGNLPLSLDLRKIVDQLQKMKGDAPEKVERSTPAFTPPPPKVVSPPAPTAASNIVVTNSDELIQAIKARRPSVGALLVCAQKHQLVEDRLELYYSAGHFAVKQLSDKILKRELEQLIAELTQSKIKSLLLKEGSGTASAGPKRDFVIEAKKAALEDPVVLQVSRLLEGEVESVVIEGIKT